MTETVKFEDLLLEVTIPEHGITSRALMSDDATRVVIFGFDAGEELSEHTAAMPAILQVLSGEAKLKLGDTEMDAKPGSWAYMPANLPHTVLAIKPLVMLLILLKSAKPA